jgi:hypothetical protein
VRNEEALCSVTINGIIDRCMYDTPANKRLGLENNTLKCGSMAQELLNLLDEIKQNYTYLAVDTSTRRHEVIFFPEKPPSATPGACWKIRVILKNVPPYYP